MSKVKFEIKVALLGYVSVGKTTLLNAMFREKFSEVSMQRTTAGINHFRIVKPEEGEATPDSISSDGTEKSDGKVFRGKSTRNQGRSVSSSDDDSATPANKKQRTTKSGPSKATTSRLSPSSILKEIKEDNAALRKSNKIEEKYFDVELEQNLCEMRSDTSLVIVDIPGINEADSNSIYMKYVQDKWTTFDCVIVVMDATKGAETEDQVELIKFIKNNVDQKKSLPVIFVCNKVDDPDQQELNVLIQGIRKKVEGVFKVGCREKALDQLIGGKASTKSKQKLFPAVIRMSASHAFFYRTASLMTFDQFKKFDSELIDKIGRYELGFKWKKMKDTDKYRELFLGVSSDSDYEERLEATHFDKFLMVLSESVGGEELQLELIRKQVDVTLRALSDGTCSAQQLRVVYEKSRVLGENPAPKLKRAFWRAFSAREDKSFSAFDALMDVAKLQDPLKLLEEYQSFLRPLGWTEEERRMVTTTQTLVRRQIGIIFTRLQAWDMVQWERTFMERERAQAVQSNNQDGYKCYCGLNHPILEPTVADTKLGWSTLTPHDWNSILKSLRLVSSSKLFCKHFGSELFLLEDLVQKSTSEWTIKPCECPHCNGWPGMFQAKCANCHRNVAYSVPQPPKCWKQYADCKFVRGEFQPVDKTLYDKLVQIKIPSSPCDNKHWGNLAWRCCELIEALDSFDQAL